MTNHLLLAVVLTFAGLASTGIVALALIALVRRRSWPYLLVALALATLLARTALGVATLTMTDVFEPVTHHTLEHALDVLMAALVIAAVYTARQARRPIGRRDGGASGSVSGSDDPAGGGADE